MTLVHGARPSPSPPPEDIRAALPARGRGGAPLVYLPEVGSTNDYAAALAADGAPDGTVVLAGRQTAGRGRRGRGWHSPPDAGLYVSVLLRGAPPPLLTLLAGVALAEALGETGVAAELKWPNDVVLPAAPGGGAAADALRRKVAGILTERLPPAAGDGAVVGIGVNLVRTERPPELAARAISLEEAGARAVDRGRRLAALLAELRRGRAALATDGAAALLDRWRKLSPSCRGASVSWEAPEGRRAGRTAGLGADGALLVDCGARTERLVGGAVRWA